MSVGQLNRCTNAVRLARLFLSERVHLYPHAKAKCSRDNKRNMHRGMRRLSRMIVRMNEVT